MVVVVRFSRRIHLNPYASPGVVLLLPLLLATLAAQLPSQLASHLDCIFPQQSPNAMRSTWSANWSANRVSSCQRYNIVSWGHHSLSTSRGTRRVVSRLPRCLISPTLFLRQTNITGRHFEWNRNTDNGPSRLDYRRAGLDWLLEIGKKLPGWPI